MVKLEAFRSRESSESFVSLNLMLWSQFDWSLRDYMAIILNSSHVVKKSIDLFQVNSYDQALWVNFFSWVEFSLNLFWSFLNLCSRLRFNLMQNFVWFPLEKLTSKGIIPIFMLIIECWEGFKYHIICWAAPIKFLLWEFESVVIANSYGDIVISFDTADSTPKE